MSAEALEQYAEESEPAAIQVEAQPHPEGLQADHHLRPFTRDRPQLKAPQRALHTTVLLKETIPEADTIEG